MSRWSDPLTRLVRDEEQADADVRATTFVRGLVLGALVGAAIAGSTIWQRRRQAEASPSVAAEPLLVDDERAGA